VLISAIVARARTLMVATGDVFWTDAELIEHAQAAVKDLWRAISNQHQDYFFTTDPGVSMEANSGTLTDVPENVSIVLGIEPVDPNTYRTLNFFPRRYTHPEMIAARARPAGDPESTGPIYYAPTGAGGPVGAPTIYVAPKITVTVPLRLTYIPTIPTITADTENPVPGESDDAIVAWVTAHGLGKQNNNVPDAVWMSKYGTEKGNILLFVAPRQDDEPDVAEAMFEDLWS
jgi:hypothetical protein